MPKKSKLGPLIKKLTVFNISEHMLKRTLPVWYVSSRRRRTTKKGIIACSDTHSN